MQSSSDIHNLITSFFFFILSDHTFVTFSSSLKYPDMCNTAGAGKVATLIYIYGLKLSL